MKKRNINIDLIKCVAVFCVISVHFFLNNGFYDKEVANFNMYLGLFILIPFINPIYNNNNNLKREKAIININNTFLTSFQGICNIKYNLIPD